MRKLTVPLIVLGAFFVSVLASTPARAQATRTWVSGVGDDANPCSRTAPCKTFAGAISKTATAGEINALDPGGFGGVTITKSITISSEGFEAGVLVSGTNAIIINALTTSTVVLRGLDIDGLGTGLVGIKVLGGLAALHVEKCTINNFRGTNGSGIEIATTTGSTQVLIKDTIVRNSGAGTGGGIFINPTAPAVVKASLDNVRMEQNLFGLRAESTSNVSVKNSVAAGNTGTGFIAVAVGGTSVGLSLSQCASTNNGTGLITNGATVVARIVGSTFTFNDTGLSAQAGSQIISAGNNFNSGNGNDTPAANGAPTSTPGQQ